MYSIDLPVPPAFVITTQAYKNFLISNNIMEKIYDELKDFDVENNEELQRRAENCRNLILSGEIAEDLKNEIIEAYDAMNVNEDILNVSKSALDLIKAGRSLPYVAVRSSATAEDLPSIAEDSQVLVRINGKTIYNTIKNIYKKYGDGINCKIEVIAMENNKAIWKLAKQIYAHSAKDKKLYKIITETGREITVSKDHSLIVLDSNTLKPKTICIGELKGGEKVPVIKFIFDKFLNRPILKFAFRKSFRMKHYELFLKNILWDGIKEVQEISYDGMVYDFVVPGVENFAAGIGGIITHNTASFAGQQATILNVKGNKNLLNAVRECWASLYTARAVYYRVQHKFPHEKVFIAVIIQKQIQSTTAGVIFTVNPSTNDESEIVIEAGFGLGELVVTGQITPDMYIVNRDGLTIKSKTVNEQDVKLILDPNTNQNIRKPIEEEDKKKQKLQDYDIIKLAELANKIEEHYKFPQDIEFATENSKLYIVQTRAVTTLGKVEEIKEKEEGKIILKGLAASPHIGTGKVKIIHDVDELSKIEKGDILVTKMTNPDMVPGMRRAVAIVTDEGGISSHAAIVSRELGLACVVGTHNATQLLKENQLVTVDGSKGFVYEGTEEIKEELKEHYEPQPEIETITKVKVNCDLPEAVENALKQNPDGVGLLRLEFIIAEGKTHPAKYIKDGRDEEYKDLIKEGIRNLAKKFFPRPVWVRTSDIRTDEYRDLEGGEDEPKESNPMLGLHGIRRGLKDKDILRAEMKAIKELYDEGLTNISVMLPFVISPEEVKESKEILKELNAENIPLGVMIETPASVWMIEDICKEGISFVSFGTNDLTQTVLAVDRNNENLQYLYNELNPAVLRCINYVIKVCKKYNVETSICGQAGSNPEMAEVLVKFGIDSISANIDAVRDIRSTVNKAEKRLMLEAARMHSE